MIASVQYNDLRGTAAADISDFYRNSLQEYLMETYEAYDAERYYCEGCDIWSSDSSNMVNVSFVCLDKVESKHVILVPEGYTYEQFFQLFKRFNVVMGIDINEVKVTDDDRIKLK